MSARFSDQIMLHIGAFGYTVTDLTLTDAAPVVPTPAEAGQAPIPPEDFALPVLLLVTVVATVMVLGRRQTMR